MAVFIGSTSKSNSKSKISIAELNNIGNKIINVDYRRKGALFSIPIASVMKSFDNKKFIVITAETKRSKMMMSTQQIYAYGKKNVDYYEFDTAKQTKSFIDKIDY